MSRFLQRVIATAQNPGGSIHPMVGSVYSSTPTITASPADQADATLTVYSNIDSSDRGRHVGAAESRAAFVSRRETGDSTGHAARDLGHAPARGPEESRVPPVNPISEPRDQWEASRPGQEVTAHGVAASRGIAAMGAAATVDAASASRKPIPNRGGDTLQISNAAIAARDAAASDRYAFFALMPDRVAGTAPGDIAPVVSSVRSRKADADEAHDRSHRLRPAAREADEINIHIGRIEVTAAAPAAARAPAAPPRKSPSLDDFLKRRPGRPG
jgi:hypothetical protein